MTLPDNHAVIPSMRFKGSAIFGLGRLILCIVFFFAVAPAIGQTMPKELTKQSDEKFDIPEELTLFYKELLYKNEEIDETQERLVEAGRDEDYRSPQAGGPDIVEWQVNSFRRVKRESEEMENSDSVYLIMQPIVLGFHYGYAVKKYIVSKVRVIYHAESVTTNEKGDTRLLRNTLTMKFEGFVDFEVKPIK